MKIEVTDEFKGWIDSLKDPSGRARVQARIERLACGNPGDHRVLKGGICELKVDVGPGYRVYYTQRKDVLIVLLVGGDKSTQKEDIRKAKMLSSTI